MGASVTRVVRVVAQAVRPAVVLGAGCFVGERRRRRVDARLRRSDRGRCRRAADGGEGALHLSDGLFLQAALVGFGEVRLQVGPGALSERLGVPFAEVEREDTRVLELVVVDADERDVGDRIAAFLSNSLRVGGLLPDLLERFHWFPRFSLRAPPGWP